MEDIPVIRAAFSILPGTANQAEQVDTLARRTIPPAYDRPDLTTAQREETQRLGSSAVKSFTGALTANARAAFVALDSDKNVIGFVIAQRLMERVAEIDWIVVDARYHGSHVAQSLLEAALRWIGPESEVQLGVITYNRRAIAFYKRSGFAETDETSGNHLISRMLMRRPATA